MKRFYFLGVSIVAAVLIAPQIALAVWWNPFSWFTPKQTVSTEMPSFGTPFPSNPKQINITTPVVETPQTFPVVTFTAKPTKVALGKTSTITWSATNADSCTSSGDPAMWFFTGGMTNGSVQTSAINTDKIYSLTCTSPDGGVLTHSVTVSLATGVATKKILGPAPTLDLSASSFTVDNNGKTTIIWSTNNATACAAYGGWWSGTKQTGASSETTKELPGPAKYTFSLACAGPGGGVEKSITVYASAPAVVAPACPWYGCWATPPASPVDGGWSGWSDYGTCYAVACGSTGVHSRTRTCTNPAPANGGSACVGSNVESESCASLACAIVEQPQVSKIPSGACSYDEATYAKRGLYSDGATKLNGGLYVLAGGTLGLNNISDKKYSTIQISCTNGVLNETIGGNALGLKGACYYDEAAYAKRGLYTTMTASDPALWLKTNNATSIDGKLYLLNLPGINWSLWEINDHSKQPYILQCKDGVITEIPLGTSATGAGSGTSGTSVTANTSNSSVTLTPLSSIIYREGDKIAISWRGLNVPTSSAVAIFLTSYPSGQSLGVLAKDQSSISSSFTWTVPPPTCVGCTGLKSVPFGAYRIGIKVYTPYGAWVGGGTPPVNSLNPDYIASTESGVISITAK